MIKSLLYLFLLTSSFVASARPLWYSELGRIEGVNLPRLMPSRDLVKFFSHQSFINNMTQMEWNSFRVPVEWDQFTDQKSIEIGIAQLESLVESLKKISKSQNNRRILLMIDFHQFKFGKVCGGVGIPRIVDEAGLSAKDPNCLFRAFKLFWENNNGVQDQWIRFAIHLLKSIEGMTLANKSWLTIGVEPINEPFFGTNGDFLPKENTKPTELLKIFNFLSKELLTKGINEDLFPFYQRFINALEKDVSREFLENSLFVLDPILMDHLGIMVGAVPLFLKGDYQIFNRLKKSQGGIELTWLAAPHQYGGAYDPAYFDIFPQMLVPMLKNYPNPAFHSWSVNYRIELQRKTFARAGMETIIGEWGTYFTLKDAVGRPGGAVSYTEDVLKGVNSKFKGHLWWIYDFNNEHDSQSYYLLEGSDRPKQEFKCEIVKAVFKKECRLQ